MAAPSSTAHQADSSEDSWLSAPRILRLLYLAGALLIAAAFVIFAFAAAAGLRGEDLASEGISNRLAQPAVLLLMACIPLFLAELMRRSWAVENPGRESDTTSVIVRAIPVVVHVVWTLVAVALYIVLVPLPLALSSGTGDVSAVFAEASEDFWILLSVYGFVAAGVAGILAASLLRKWAYAVLASDERLDRQYASTQTFWFVVSAKWRAEGYFAFVAAGVAGMLPILWHDAAQSLRPIDLPALTIVLAIALSCGAVAVLISLNAWRSGAPVGYGESVE